MTPFGAKLGSGEHLLGFAVSETDLQRLGVGESVQITLESTGIGLWWKERDGTRVFIQPRQATVLLIPGEDKNDVFAFLNVKGPST